MTKKPDETGKVTWPPPWIRRIRRKSIGKMPIIIRTDLTPHACSARLRYKMLNAFYAGKKLRLKHKDKVTIGEVYRWFEEDWIGEGYAFDLRKYFLSIELMARVKLEGVVIPMENGSLVKAKISFIQFFIYPLVIWASLATVGLQDKFGRGVFAVIVFSIVVALIRSIFDIKFLKDWLALRIEGR